jgi:hypothetical protein
MKKLVPAGALAAGLVVALSWTVLAAQAALTQISSDPFTNPTSSHRTEVEPDTLSAGSTIVSTFQVGRFFNGGSSDIGFSTSTNNGAHFTNGVLPGLTFQVDPSSPYERVSDASVAFDAKHNVWLISSIPLLPSLVVPTVFISRSTDGGQTWGSPISAVSPTYTSKVDLDKNWTVCDNTPLSPFFGNCYTEFDNFGQGDLEQMITSTDGGLTWSAPLATADTVHGLGGQPLVQPNGTVVVPFESLQNTIGSFTSENGGASWDASEKISHVKKHPVAGNLRSSPLPSAEIDGAGTVYVAWQDCRFSTGCKANDIAFSTSTDGKTWTTAARATFDSPQVDHFIPGIAVDKATSGSSAHIALSFNFYENSDCTVSTCQLHEGFVSSTDAGATWTGTSDLAGPMLVTWLPLTSQGFMVGDYQSTSFDSRGAAHPVFAVATAPNGSLLNEAMFTPASGLSLGGGSNATQVAGDGTSSGGSTSTAITAR